MSAQENAEWWAKHGPRAYNLEDQAERDRLLHETESYARVSLHHGTDDKGRRFAATALRDAIALGYRLVKVQS